MEGKDPNFSLHSQAGAGSGELAMSPHQGAVLSSALFSELVAVAAWSSWWSLACPKYCMASLAPMGLGCHSCRVYQSLHQGEVLHM